jgi:hypothetical protein
MAIVIAPTREVASVKEEKCNMPDMPQINIGYW